MSPNVLARVLSEYGIDVRRCRLTGVTPGFSGAVVHRVELPERTMALRGWPRDDLPPTRLHGLHAFLRHVFDAGLEVVAVPTTASNGDTLVHVAGRAWQLEPWMPGAPELLERPTPARVAAAAQCLATCHEAAGAFVPDHHGHEWFGVRTGPPPAVVERIRRIEVLQAGQLQRLSERLAVEQTRFAELGRLFVERFRQNAATVRRELESLARERVRLLPCWRDLHGEHVLYEGDRVTGLLDASACRVESVAVDLARLLGDVLGDDSSARDAAVAAYTAVRRLTVVERELVDVLDRSAVLLMGLTWLDRCYSRGWAIDTDPRVLSRLERIAGRLPPRS